MTTRILFTFAFALLVPCVTLAQGTAQKKPAAQKPDESKFVRPVRKSFLQSCVADLSDLTDAQKTKIRALEKEAGDKQKQLSVAAGITAEMHRKRRFAFHTLPLTMKSKELNDKANRAAGFNAEQVKTLVAINEVYRKFRFASMRELTPAQRELLPKWIKDDYAKSLKIAEQNRAAKN